jgi:SNF2 family DNA or RNA helicase
LEENEIDEIEGCPLCIISGVPITAAGPRPWASDRPDSYLRQEGHSSKMNALIKDIRKDLWGKKRYVRPGTAGQKYTNSRPLRSIVFSCWTNTLNLIEKYLRKENIPFQRIDGDCPLGRRQRILNDFSQTAKTPVLIMTTGTGAYG